MLEPGKDAKTVIEIRMLGGFELSVSGHAVSNAVGRTHQLWNLLGYLVSNRRKTITQDELIEMLWPDESSDNPANALKNLVYRVRSMLAAADIPEAKDMVTLPPRRLSVEQRQRLPRRHRTVRADGAARRGQGPRRRDARRMLLEAVSLYRGDFLPLLAYEKWVVPHSHLLPFAVFSGGPPPVRPSVRRQALHRAVRRLHQGQRNRPLRGGSPPLLHPLAGPPQQGQRGALPLQLRVGSVFQGAGHPPFRRDAGHLPRDRRDARQHPDDLGIIKEDLSEKSMVNGAFFCEYEVFRSLYRVEARAAARTGQTVFVGLRHRRRFKRRAPAIQKLSKVMDELAQVIRLSAARGDVVSRFSATQNVLNAAHADLRERRDGARAHPQALPQRLPRAGRHHHGVPAAARPHPITQSRAVYPHVTARWHNIENAERENASCRLVQDRRITNNATQDDNLGRQA